MAVPTSLRNQFACIETGKRAEPMPKCSRCPAILVRRGGRMCGPCSADRYEERRQRMRASYQAKMQCLPKPPKPQRPPKPDTIAELGRAAQRAGLTVASIEAMGPAMTPEEQRLMNHG